jgi:hypothetical protein
MKRLITLATVLLVGLASAQAAQTDDQQQQKKKKKKAQTTQTTQTSSGGQTSNHRNVSSQTSNRNVKAQTSNRNVKAQTSNPHVSSQTSSNQQATNRYYKPGHSNAEATAKYNHQNTQVVQTNKSKKSKNQTNIVTNSNVQVNKKAWRHYKRTGNERSFSQAQHWNWRQRHDRNWWHRNNYRLVLYGGGYWYWNSGWWYPAYGYDPYYSHYVYDGPIFGYGYAAPGDVTVEVQRALAQQGYYYGPIDGILGPGTRSAIQRYQIDHGLAVTAAIDEQTLYTLGLT